MLLAAPRAKIVERAGDAAVALAALEAVACAAGGARVVLDEAAAWGDGDAAAARWRDRLADADVVVDALFGTGLRADAVTGVPALAIAAMNAAPGFKIAVDIPSGIEADSGRALRRRLSRRRHRAPWGRASSGSPIDADVAGGPRRGRRRWACPFDPPAALGPFCHLSTSAPTLAEVPRRGPSGHKGTARPPAGRRRLGRQDRRGGAGGRARRCAPAPACARWRRRRPGRRRWTPRSSRLMSACYADGDDADAGSAGRLAALASGMRALAIGPGIPTGPGMRALIEALVARLPLPMVIDADALNLLGADVGARPRRRRPAPRVLTPHPGEMARLLGVSHRRGAARARGGGAPAGGATRAPWWCSRGRAR